MYNFEDNVHKMWSSWSNGFRFTITVNIGTLAILAGLKLLSPGDISLPLASLFISFFVFLMLSLLVAFVSIAAGEMIMELHMSGGKEQLEKNLKERGLEGNDISTYQFLGSIGQWRYTVVKYGPGVLAFTMISQWLTLFIIGIIILTGSSEPSGAS